MESREITIRFTLNQKSALLFVALLFLGWNPLPVGSETLTLTTYYPAPYGGYVSLLTTGQTLLARDAGNVGVGVPSPQVKLDVAQGTAIRVGRAVLSSGGDYVHLANNEWYNGGSWVQTGGAGALLQMAGQGINFYRHDGAGGHTQSAGIDASGNFSFYGQINANSNINANANLNLNGDLVMPPSGLNLIRGACETKVYQPNNTNIRCTTKYRLVGSYGDGIVRYWGYMVTPQGVPDQRLGMGRDWGGLILCCRIDATAR